MENREIDAFEEMRSQISILKEKLETENIINDRLIRKVMKFNFNRINRQAWTSIICSLLVILAAIFSFGKLGFSNYFRAFTVILMLICDYFTWKMHRNINRETMMKNLKQVTVIIRKLKEDYLGWMKYGIVIILFWGSWFCTECIVNAPAEDKTIGIIMSAGALAGLAIGAFVGLKMHRSVIRSCDEILGQIREE